MTKAKIIVVPAHHKTKDPKNSAKKLEDAEFKNLKREVYYINMKVVLLVVLCVILCSLVLLYQNVGGNGSYQL